MIKEIIKYFDELKNTDLKRIKVTSSGDFYMSSEDIFNDRKESLDLIKSLRKSVISYKARTEKKLNA